MDTDTKSKKQRKTKPVGEEFDVGYKKPPKPTRFKRGKSGNPKGRPKGSRNLLVLIDDELDKQVVLQENGRSLKLTKREVVVKRLVNQALNGEGKAISTLIGMDKDNKDPEDKIVELSSDDQDQFNRFLERMTKGKIRQMERAKQQSEVNKK